MDNFIMGLPEGEIKRALDLLMAAGLVERVEGGGAVVNAGAFGKLIPGPISSAPTSPESEGNGSAVLGDLQTETGLSEALPTRAAADAKLAGRRKSQKQRKPRKWQDAQVAQAPVPQTPKDACKSNGCEAAGPVSDRETALLNDAAQAFLIDVPSSINEDLRISLPTQTSPAVEIDPMPKIDGPFEIQLPIQPQPIEVVLEDQPFFPDQPFFKDNEAQLLTEPSQTLDPGSSDLASQRVEGVDAEASQSSDSNALQSPGPVNQEFQAATESAMVSEAGEVSEAAMIVESAVIVEPRAEGTERAPLVEPAGTSEQSTEVAAAPAIVEPATVLVEQSASVTEQTAEGGEAAAVTETAGIIEQSAEPAAAVAFEEQSTEVAVAAVVVETAGTVEPGSIVAEAFTEPAAGGQTDPAAVIEQSEESVEAATVAEPVAVVEHSGEVVAVRGKTDPAAVIEQSEESVEAATVAEPVAVVEQSAEVIEAAGETDPAAVIEQSVESIAAATIAEPVAVVEQSAELVEVAGETDPAAVIEQSEESVEAATVAEPVAVVEQPAEVIEAAGETDPAAVIEQSEESVAATNIGEPVTVAEQSAPVTTGSVVQGAPVAELPEEIAEPAALGEVPLASPGFEVFAQIPGVVEASEQVDSAAMHVGSEEFQPARASTIEPTGFSQPVSATYEESVEESPGEESVVVSARTDLFSTAEVDDGSSIAQDSQGATQAFLASEPTEGAILYTVEEVHPVLAIDSEDPVAQAYSESGAVVEATLLAFSVEVEQTPDEGESAEVTQAAEPESTSQIVEGAFSFVEVVEEPEPVLPDQAEPDRAPANRSVASLETPAEPNLPQATVETATVFLPPGAEEPAAITEPGEAVAEAALASEVDFGEPVGPMSAEPEEPKDPAQDEVSRGPALVAEAIQDPSYEGSLPVWEALASTELPVSEYEAGEQVSLFSPDFSQLVPPALPEEKGEEADLASINPTTMSVSGTSEPEELFAGVESIPAIPSSAHAPEADRVEDEAESLYRAMRELEEKLRFLEHVDFYQMLGVDKLASTARISRAYGAKKEALNIYRDRWVGSGVLNDKLNSLFCKYSEAYSTLADLEKRRIYDQPSQGSGASQRPANFESNSTPSSTPLRVALPSTRAWSKPAANPAPIKPPMPVPLKLPPIPGPPSTSVSLTPRLNSGPLTQPPNAGAGRPNSMAEVVSAEPKPPALPSSEIARNDKIKAEQTAAIRLQQGVSLFKKKDIYAALNLFRESVKLDPRKAEGHYYLGLTLSILSRARKTHAHHAGCHVTCTLEGNLPANQRVRHEAVDHMRKAAELDPHNVRILADLAGLYKDAGMPKRAEYYLDRAMLLNTGNQIASAAYGVVSHNSINPTATEPAPKKPQKK
jgi:tetratricopeptide (TPR) repeat protein